MSGAGGDANAVEPPPEKAEKSAFDVGRMTTQKQRYTGNRGSGAPAAAPKPSPAGAAAAGDGEDEAAAAKAAQAERIANARSKFKKGVNAVKASNRRKNKVMPVDGGGP